MQEEQRAPARIEPRRAWLRALLIVFPLVLFASIELGLRLVGFGGTYPLFVDVQNMPGYLAANDQLILRYYSQAPELAIDAIPFLKQKPPGSYRVVVQGGSTAAGFPYGRFGGLAGMLGQRLEATFPEREIEVISSALAAVNSYTLLDLVDEIIEIEPDAVLIYVGHNEFVGILGVGSGLAAAATRPVVLLQLEFRKLRSYQLLERMIRSSVGWLRAVFDASGNEEESSRGTLIAAAASSASAPYGSALYHEGITQFESNLASILRSYREAGIDVYLGTLASNEKDQKPFSSLVSSHVDKRKWRQTWQAFRAAEQAADSDSAREALLVLLDLDPDAADVWYALGRLDRQAGRLGAAREAFRAAKDRDALRFRAPEVFNERIRQLAREFGATLVDVQQQLADASPDGILGDELMLEHVHPNSNGYFLLADAYYEAMRANGVIGDWSMAPSRDRAKRQMPITVLQRLLADLAVLELKSTFPFRENQQPVVIPKPRNKVELLAQRLHRGDLDWLEAMERLLQILRRAGRIERAAVVARMAAQTYPADAAPNYSAGMLLAQSEQFALAQKYLNRSLRAEPNHLETLAALVSTNLALGDEERARGHYARLRELDPTHPALETYSQLVR